MPLPDLPNEVLLLIVEHVIPTDPVPLFPREHPVTQTLLSLSLTCKLTRPASQRLLTKHCIPIDSITRLNAFLDINTKPQQWKQTTSLFLAPFPYEDLNDLYIAKRFNRLSLNVSATLRRLVIDMPLRYLYPSEGVKGVRKIIRRAFCRLTALEEFCSAQDELFGDTSETEIEPWIWESWSRLRRLALYNANIDDDFVDALPTCKNLTHLVVARPDSFYVSISQAVYDRLIAACPLKRVILVNTLRDHLRDLGCRGPGWGTSFGGQLTCVDPDHKVEPELVFATVPIPALLEPDNNCDIELTQNWLCRHAMDGSLWDCKETDDSLEIKSRLFC